MVTWKGSRLAKKGGVFALWITVLAVAQSAMAVDFDIAIGEDVSTTACSAIVVVRRIVFALVGLAIIRGIALAANSNERGWAFILTGLAVGFLNLTFPTWAAAYTTNCALV